MWCLDGVPWSVQPRYDELRGVVSSVFPMRKVKEHDAGGCSPPSRVLTCCFRQARVGRTRQPVDDGITPKLWG